jgi:anti-sigma factor RsiW
MLTCEQTRERLDDLLDDGQRPGGEIATHLKTCDECREHYLSLQELETRLRGAARSHAAEIPREAPRRALAAIEARKPRRVNFWFYGLSAACLLALALALSSHFAPKPPAISQLVPALPVKKIAQPTVVTEEAAPQDLKALLASPDRALKNEGQKLLSDVQNVKSFLIRCVAVSNPDERG